MLRYLKKIGSDQQSYTNESNNRSKSNKYDTNSGNSTGNVGGGSYRQNFYKEYKKYFDSGFFFDIESDDDISASGQNQTYNYTDDYESDFETESNHADSGVPPNTMNNNRTKKPPASKPRSWQNETNKSSTYFGAEDEMNNSNGDGGGGYKFHASDPYELLETFAMYRLFSEMSNRLFEDVNDEEMLINLAKIISSFNIPDRKHQRQQQSQHSNSKSSKFPADGGGNGSSKGNKSNPKADFPYQQQTTAAAANVARNNTTKYPKSSTSARNGSDFVYDESEAANLRPKSTENNKLPKMPAVYNITKSKNKNSTSKNKSRNNNSNSRNNGDDDWEFEWLGKSNTQSNRQTAASESPLPYFVRTDSDPDNDEDNDFIANEETDLDYTTYNNSSFDSTSPNDHECQYCGRTLNNPSALSKHQTICKRLSHNTANKCNQSFHGSSPLNESTASSSYSSPNNTNVHNYSTTSSSNSSSTSSSPLTTECAKCKLTMHTYDFLLHQCEANSRAASDSTTAKTQTSTGNKLNKPSFYKATLNSDSNRRFKDILSQNNSNKSSAFKPVINSSRRSFEESSKTAATVSAAAADATATASKSSNTSFAHSDFVFSKTKIPQNSNTLPSKKVTAAGVATSPNRSSRLLAQSTAANTDNNENQLKFNAKHVYSNLNSSSRIQKPIVATGEYYTTLNKPKSFSSMHNSQPATHLYSNLAAGSSTGPYISHNKYKPSPTVSSSPMTSYATVNGIHGHSTAASTPAKSFTPSHPAYSVHSRLTSRNPSYNGAGFAASTATVNNLKYSPINISTTGLIKREKLRTGF